MIQIFSLIITLCLLGLLTNAAIQIGAIFLQLLKRVEDHDEQRISVYFFTGQSLLATFALICSLLLDKSALYLIYSIVIVAGIFLSRTMMPLKLALRFQKISLFLAILICVLLFHFGFSLHAPSEWDEVSYHFPVMQELAEGKIQFPLLSKSPYIDFYAPFSVFYGSLPYHSESYASILFVLSHGAVSAAHLVYLLNFVFFLLFFRQQLKKWYTLESPLSTSILVLLSTNYGIVILLGTGLVDINTLIYQFLSYMLLLEVTRSDTKQSLTLSAFMFGTALAHKFTSLFLLPPFALLFLYLLYQRRSKGKILYASLVSSILGGSVWYIKNLLTHQNPLYPLYFGHKGLSEEAYRFLYNTLIANIQGPRDPISLLKTLYVHYHLETSTLIVSALLFCSIFLMRKLRTFEIYLLGSGLFFYLVNFYFGSQLSRYVIFFPVVLHFLSARFIKKYSILPYIMIAFVLLSIKTSPIQSSIWKSRLEAQKEYTTPKKQKGCIQSFLLYQTEAGHEVPPGSVLNLWDAYESVTQEKTGKYHVFLGAMSYDPNQLPSTIRFVYSNTEWKNIITQYADAHRDMHPERRVQLEQSLLEGKKPVFQQGPCEFYSL